MYELIRFYREHNFENWRIQTNRDLWASISTHLWFTIELKDNTKRIDFGIHWFDLQSLAIYRGRPAHLTAPDYTDTDGIIGAVEEEASVIVQLTNRVQDGTRCRSGSLDMCIQGKCQVSLTAFFYRRTESTIYVYMYIFILHNSHRV